ncbi:MAG: hypothetical protein D6706_03240 [Chloroflexi bacterium]|nr:MAG: hypothetical protein D6706_03240 [Chloroflexota bacterium]
MTVQSVNTEKRQDSFLRQVLRGNGIFSEVSGLFFIVAAGPIGRFLGADTPLVYVILGIGLVGYGALLLLATRRVEVRSVGKTAVALDLLWVIGSYALILSNIIPFTTAGKWAVGIIAEVVALFATLQIYGLWRMRHTE